MVRAIIRKGRVSSLTNSIFENVLGCDGNSQVHIIKHLLRQIFQLVLMEHEHSHQIHQVQLTVSHIRLVNMRGKCE